MAPIIRELKYSILPKPYGCFLVGFLFDNLTPIKVTTDDTASVKLLTASRIIAIELAIIPTTALAATKNTLVIMPIALTLTMFF